ncbi:MAG: hypothetical protein ACFFAS_03855 [Promethearchaeota archaeon]
MIADKNQLLDILNRYNMTEINAKDTHYDKGVFHLLISKKDERDRTHIFHNFVFAFNRVLLFYEDILDYMQRDELKYKILCENSIILLITSLETYLRDSFKMLSCHRKIDDIDFRQLEKFLKCFRLRTSLDFDYYNSLKTETLYSFLEREKKKRKLDFQRKDNLKIAFKLLDINLYELDRVLWEKIFTNEDSWAELRHFIIHSGGERTVYKFGSIDISKVEKCMENIAQFIFLLEKETIKKYPRTNYNRI